jgi:hypothetical protein
VSYAAFQVGQAYPTWGCHALALAWSDQGLCALRGACLSAVPLAVRGSHCSRIHSSRGEGARSAAGRGTLARNARCRHAQGTLVAMRAWLLSQAEVSTGYESAVGERASQSTPNHSLRQPQMGPGRPQGRCRSGLKPIEYIWSYSACRIGHLVPIWQLYIGSSFQQRAGRAPEAAHVPKPQKDGLLDPCTQQQRSCP